jgi:hypothetical protein
MISSVDLDPDLGRINGVSGSGKNGPQEKRKKNGTQFITKNVKLSLWSTGGST